MTLRTVDLFAGCGGLSLGFQKEKYNRTQINKKKHNKVIQNYIENK